MKELVYFIIFLIVWVLCGFIGFLIEAKLERVTKFNEEVKVECLCCILFGVVSFIVMVFYCIRNWFIKFMNNLLWKMNHKE